MTRHSVQGMVWILFGILLSTLASCASDDTGAQAGKVLAPTPDPGGTRIQFDPLARPLPEIPFPNDMATVLEPGSPTGRRLNVRMHAPTQLESDVRTNLNGLDGFGTFSPITVSFEKPLDLGTLTADNVLLLNVDPASPDFGRRIPLDLPDPDVPVTTAFPLIIEGDSNIVPTGSPDRPDFSYFHFDEHWNVNNLMLEGLEEDANCNGVLDAGEDLDFDGVLDHPNVAYAACYNPACFRQGSPHPEVCPGDTAWPLDLDDRLVSHFEYETNTLILKPLVALDQRTRHAVVLTRGVRDVDGIPIRSPFPSINHASQSLDLAGLRDILPGYGIPLSEVAFTWSFTTQSITWGLEVIRDGLKGRGSMAWLADRYPPVIESVMDHEVCALGECGEVEGGGTIRNTHILKPAAMKELFGIVLAAMTFSWIDFSDLTGMIESLLDAYERYVDYIVVGSFSVPMFLEGPDSHFDVNLRTGAARVHEESVPFWLVVPKSRGPEGPSWYPEPPFPVAFYGHGYSGSKEEALGFAPHLARFGLATFAMDETGHGPSAELADLKNVLDEIAQDEDGNEQSLDELLAQMGPLRAVVLDLLAGLVAQYDPESEGPDALREACEAYTDPDNPKCEEPGACAAKCIVLKFTETPLFQGAFLSGRAVDQTGDGVPDSGVDFWTARSFHTRDIVRQAVIDYMQALRFLRGFDGVRTMEDMDGDGLPEIAGDFNGDGVVDAGGPCIAGVTDCDPDDADDPTRQNYSGMGQSMGAFIMTVLQTVEPGLTAIAPISGGAGLMDIGMRTSNEGVREAVYLEVMGPLLIGGRKEHMCRKWTYYEVCEDEDFTGEGDGWYLAFDALDGNLERIRPVCPMPALRQGDRIEVLNLANGEQAMAGVRGFGVDEEGAEILGFRANIAADRGDRLLVRVFDGVGGGLLWERELQSIGKGYGHGRNSPDLRRMMGLSQMILDPADPVNYVPHLFRDPLAGMKPKSGLIIHTLGDMKVPIGTGLSVARSAGLLDYIHPMGVYGGRTENQMLLDHYVAEAIPRIPRFPEHGLGKYFDPDDLAEGLDDDCDRGSYPGGHCREHALEEPHIPDFYPEAAGDFDATYLRKTLDTPGLEHRNHGKGEQSGFRLPNIMVYDNALQVEDRHGIFLSAPSKPFNLDQYMIYLIGRYFQTRAAELLGGSPYDNATCLENRKNAFGRPVNACEFWEGTP